MNQDTLKRKHIVAIKLNDVMFEKLMLLQNRIGTASKASTVEQCILLAYDKTFPAYKDHPVAISARGSEDTTITQARARVLTKTVMKKEEERELYENGVGVCENYLSGKVVGKGGPIENVACSFKWMNNAPQMSDRSDIPFTKLYKDVMGGWNNDERLRMFVFENKIPNNEFDNAKDMSGMMNLLTLGLERDQISASDINPMLMLTVLKQCDALELDTTNLKQAMANAGYSTEY